MLLTAGSTVTVVVQCYKLHHSLGLGDPSLLLYAVFDKLFMLYVNHRIKQVHSTIHELSMD